MVQGAAVMDWACADALSWLAALPVLALLWWWSAHSGRRRLKRFADTAMLSALAGQASALRRLLKGLLVLMAYLLLGIAAMGPQWGSVWQEISRKGVDIVIALDVSRSMLAEDIKPSRLERAKFAIRDLVESLESDRVGLMLFSAAAYEQCPLTVDRHAFLLLLDQADPQDMRHGGTALSPIVESSLRIFADSAVGEKALVIVSDGGDGDEPLDDAIRLANQEDVVIYAVGVGTPEGELIPIRDARGNVGYVKDDQGRVVKTRLNETPLKELALSTGGAYVRAGGAGFGMDRIYNEYIARLEERQYDNQMQEQRIHRYAWFAAAALLLLLLELLIRDTRSEA